MGFKSLNSESSNYLFLYRTSSFKRRGVYLDDKFNSKGNYTDLCKDRVDRAKGSTFELIALCREVKFSTRQIENVLMLYQSVFLPRLIYNSESWSNITPIDYKTLQSAQLPYLCNIMEVSKVTATVVFFFELGIYYL